MRKFSQRQRGGHLTRILTRDGNFRSTAVRRSRYSFESRRRAMREDFRSVDSCGDNPRLEHGVY